MNFSTLPRQSIYISLIMAMSYFLAGRLGLLLAIPPGYASAIFPSSGIALAALLLFGNRHFIGILLGSFVLNLTMSPNWLDVFSVGGLVALCIAVGSTIQGLVGVILIRHFIGHNNALVDDKEINKFYLIGGPISCLISATMGTTTLYLAGVVTLQSITFNWFNWWIGDVIGVFIMVPFIFCFFAQPREIWSQRTQTVIPLLLLSFISVVLVFINVSNWESNKQTKDFNEYTNNVVNSLHNNTLTYSTLLETTERFITVSDHLTRDQFNHFIFPLISSNSKIQAIEWLPVIKDKERANFEKLEQKEGFPGFRIKEQNKKMELVPAHRADEYVPVFFVEPYLNNEAALGFDLSSNPTRLKMLVQARNTGTMIGSSRIKLIQKQSTHDGLLFVRPVYDIASPLETVAQRMHHIRGYVLIVLSIPEVFKSVENRLNENNITLQVIDENEENLVDKFNKEPSLIFQMKSWKNALTHSVLEQQRHLTIGGRSWRLEFQPLPNYLVEHRSRQSWATLAGGLFFTGFLGFVLLLITGQTEKLNKNVKERTKELRIIIDNIVDGIVTIDENNLITSFNPAAEKIFGYFPNEVIGHNLGILLSDATKATWENIIKSNVLNESENTLTYQEMEGKRKDKSLFQMEFTMSRTIQSEKSFFVAVVRDITERIRIERIKNDFISTVSHELRTPLTSISGALGLINSGILGELSTQAKQMLDMAHKNSLRLTALINDLLDIEKSAAGKMVLNLELQPLAPLVMQAIESISAYGTQYNVTCKLIKYENVNVIVNGDRIVQVLINFLSNAIKFSHPGEQVDVVLKIINSTNGLDDAVVRVEVIDHGTGIPTQFRNRIFQKFSQADSSDTKQKSGTGLGLAISKDLIELMGGIVGFESHEGLGSCFYFELPIKPK